MRKLLLSVTMAALAATPAQAADWQSQAVESRPGVFVGGRLHLSLGGKTAAKPRAALTLAPTMNRMSSSGMTRSTIGEGLSLNFSPRSKPTLTLAGIRADTALGLRGHGKAEADRKLGVSSGGWIAIGVGAVAIIAGGLYLAADHIADCDEGECN
jgi:hypothetical protein